MTDYLRFLCGHFFFLSVDLFALDLRKIICNETVEGFVVTPSGTKLVCGFLLNDFQSAWAECHHNRNPTNRPMPAIFRLGTKRKKREFYWLKFNFFHPNLIPLMVGRIRVGEGERPWMKIDRVELFLTWKLARVPSTIVTAKGWTGSKVKLIVESSPYAAL